VRVMGLDLSLTAPGIALVQPPEPPLGQLVKVGSLRGVARLAHISDAVMDAALELQPDIVAIEGYSYNSSPKAHDIGELGGVVRYRLYMAEFRCEAVPAARWRRQLFGRNVSKDLVAREALKRYGIEFDSLDVLEAWCVATAVWRLHEGLDKPAPVVLRKRRTTQPAGV
jgi:hypothetical protein